MVRAVTLELFYQTVLPIQISLHGKPKVIAAKELAVQQANIEPAQQNQPKAGELVASGSSTKDQIASLKRQVAKWPAVTMLTDLRK